MIKIKGVTFHEADVLLHIGFAGDVTLNRQDYVNYLYDITLKSNIRLITRKHGIELFDYDGHSNFHYMDECMFMEVIIK